MPSASRSSMAVSVSASQLMKVIKFVSSLVLKKVFYEKRRLKTRIVWKIMGQTFLSFSIDQKLCPNEL